ncbi:unnamed protein product, partial [Ectocarpus sp. 8 AP-2014]
QEHVECLRAQAFEAKRWILQKLDVLGQPPDGDSDCDGDIEAGFGEVREALVDNGKRAASVQQSKPVRPIRRSVHRGQAGGTSTCVSSGPSSEYEGLFDCATDQQEQLPQLPRPKLATAMSSGSRPGEGKVPPLIPHHAQRRGMSFDANASGRRDLHHNDTGSARGSFALPRTPAAVLPEASADAAAAAANDDRVAAAAAAAAAATAAAAAAALGDEATVTAGVVAAFTPGPPPPPPVSGQGSYGSGSGGRGGNEQRIPEYVPPQKQGSLSKATHRRSSSRGSAVGGCGGEGGGGSGGAAVTRSGSVGRSASPPDSSPFFSVRTPPKFLPPVPAFAGGAGAGVAGDDYGNDGLAAQPQPPPPPPPPSSWNEDQLEGVVIFGGGGGGGAEAGFLEAEPLPPPPPPAVVENGLLAGGYGRPPGAAGGALLLSPKRRGSGMPISPVPFASDKRSTAAPTTPKQGSSRRRRRQQQQQRDGDEEPPSGRGSSFFAGPSPDGLDNSFSHIDYVAGFVADGIAAAAVGGGSGRKEAAAAAFERQRDERAAISVLPASPAWSADDDVNRGTGVRRRVSPRASAAAAAAAAAGAAAGAGAGGGGGGRSPRWGAGWEPIPSPKRRGSPSGGDAGNDQLRPLALAFSDETTGAAPAASPSRRAAAKELRIDVGIVRQGSAFANGGGDGGALAAKASPRAKTPLAGANKARASPLAESAAAAAAAGNNAAEEAVSTEEDTESQVGLRCSAPIYDRGRNLLGNKEPGEGGESARAAAAAAAQAPTEKRGELAGRRANADGEGVGVAAGDLCAIKDAGENDESLAAESVVPGPPVLGDSVTANAKLTEVPQASSAHGEHVRPGRDLNSSQAFAASLDLPFDQLELGELIGGGGFGQVYQGVWRGTPVAIKVLLPAAQRDLDEELAADFRAEVLMLAALRHPNVCLFMGACMVPPNRAIVTELLTRGSLWEALRADRVPEESMACSFRRGSDRSGAAGTSSRILTPQECWPWSVIMKVAEGIACGMWYLHQHEPFPILHRDLKSANLLLDSSFNPKICDFGLAR